MDVVGVGLGIIFPLVYLAAIIGVIFVVVRIVQSILRISAALERIAAALEKPPPS